MSEKNQYSLNYILKTFNLLILLNLFFLGILIFIHTNMIDKLSVLKTLADYENELLVLKDSIYKQEGENKLFNSIVNISQQIPNTSININIKRNTHMLVSHEFMGFYMDYVFRN